jgi:hypothetical protein
MCCCLSTTDFKRAVDKKLLGGYYTRRKAEALVYYDPLNAWYSWISELLDASVVHPVEHIYTYQGLVAFKKELFQFLYVESDDLFTYNKALHCWIPELKTLKYKHKLFKKWREDLLMECEQEQIDMEAVQRRLR